MKPTFIRWTCEAPEWEHEYNETTGEDCSTYQEALKKARKHFKDTGHVTRAEKCFTELFWDND